MFLWIKQAIQRNSLVLQVVKYHKNTVWQPFFKNKYIKHLTLFFAKWYDERVANVYPLTTEVEWLAFIPLETRWFVNLIV